MNIIKKIWKGARGWLITTVVVLIFLLTVSLVATQNAFLYSTISSVFGGEKSTVVSGDASKYQYYTVENAEFNQHQTSGEIKTKDDALKEANALNEEIASEGNILLKNEGNALPLGEGAKISVFGKNSVNLVYGGSGSSARSGVDIVDLYEGLENAGFEVNPTLKGFYESGESGRG
ncbi:MAG: hypothetical protein IJX05_00790, partial [Clostridia bacterium]|nr:hypothetical protein [Clostridia bacterium]